MAAEGALAGSLAHPGHFVAALRVLGVAGAVAWLLVAVLVGVGVRAGEPPDPYRLTLTG